MGRLMVGNKYIMPPADECGLCSLNSVNNKPGSFKINDDKKDDEKSSLRIISKQKLSEWDQIANTKCNPLWFLSADQLLFVLEQYAFDSVDKVKFKKILNEHKPKIISFFKIKKINGAKYCFSPGKMKLAKLLISKDYCNDRKLNGALKRGLFRSIEKSVDR